MKIFSFLVLITLSAACGVVSSSMGRGWTSLFDGKTLAGWKQSSKDAAPESAWFVKDGELIFDPAAGHGGDIVTSKSYKDFDFTLQFKISEGGNSGIKFFLIPNSSLGCEFQIIDDVKHPDAVLGMKGNRKTGSLYDILPADPNKPYKPAGQWNTVRVLSQGMHVEHWLNGSKIVEYDRGSSQFKEAIAKSKFKTTKGFAEAESSPILLQAHGDKVTFRNIRIKEL